MEVVKLTCVCQIIYMYALAKMADAIADCRNQNPFLDNVGGSHSWDEVAAFLIGSLEGPFAGGSPDIDDGQLLPGNFKNAHQRFPPGIGALRAKCRRHRRAG